MPALPAVASMSLTFGVSVKLFEVVEVGIVELAPLPLVTAVWTLLLFSELSLPSCKTTS